jgi:ribosomal protein S18 acetylase RimI-like enzyme
MIIGDLAPDEREAVVDLWRCCGLTRPWNDPFTDLALALGSPSARVLVGRDDGAILASVMVGFDGHRGWVYYLAVDPRRQGRGHGRAMMHAAEAWLSARGAPKAQLMVRSDNVRVIGFYERLGFEAQAVTVLGKRLDQGRQGPASSGGDDSLADHGPGG